MDRIVAGQHYANRTNYTFEAAKTILVDCSNSTVLDIHWAMIQSHGSQVDWQLLEGSLESMSTVTAHGGYGWWLLRNELRSGGVNPVIRAREFGWEDIAENLVVDDTTRHQRANVESVFFALRQRFGGTRRAGTRFGQFRELVLKPAVRTIELAVTASNP